MKKLIQVAVAVLAVAAFCTGVQAKTITNNMGQVIEVYTASEAATDNFNADALLDTSIKATSDDPRGLMIVKYNVANNGGNTNGEGIVYPLTYLPANAKISGPVILDVTLAFAPATITGRVSLTYSGDTGATNEIQEILAAGQIGSFADRTTNAWILAASASNLYTRTYFIHPSLVATQGAYSLYVPFVLQK